MDTSIFASRLLARKATTVAAAVAALTVGTLASIDMARANTTGATFQVSVTIQAACTVTTNPLAFGNVTAGTATAVQKTTTVSVTCPNLQAYTVGLLPTNAGGTTNGTGNLKGAANTIGYQLFQDAAYSVVWGNTNPGNTKGGTGSGVAQTINVYGQIPAASLPGTLTAETDIDTVNVTVYY